MLTRGVECGWLFTSLGSPWVAHRVCPMPQELSAQGLYGQFAGAGHSSLPLLLTTRMPPSWASATPAESYPRYSSFLQTIQQHILCAALSSITYDAAHTKHLHTDSPARTSAQRNCQLPVISLCFCMASFEGNLLRYCCRFLPLSAAGIAPQAAWPASAGGTPAETSR